MKRNNNNSAIPALIIFTIIGLVIYAIAKLIAGIFMALLNSRSNRAYSEPLQDHAQPTRRSKNDPEVKKLYMHVIHKYHPDFAQGDSDKKFRTELTAKLNNAYREGDIEMLKLFQ